MRKLIISILMLFGILFLFGQESQTNENNDKDSIFTSAKSNLIQSEDRIYHRLGLGDIDDPAAMFSAFQGEPLQKTKGDYITLYSFITNCFYNVAYNRLFLVRDANGDEWTTARFHEGISIDDSFSKPGETKTWWERDPYDNIQSWGNEGATYMTVNKGKVGVGTINPEYILDVNGTARTKGIQMDGNLQIDTNIPNGTWGSRLLFGTLYDNTDPMYISRFNKTGDASELRVCISDRNDGNDKFSVGYVTLDNEVYNQNFVVQANGKVGIMTDNPQNTLDVNGTIHAKEVKVDMIGWSDFVFDKSYKLPSLKEVEQHIETKGTLPGVPSEEEIKVNGVNLAETDVLLLQKIEELTLYVIQQQKTIDAQQKHLEKLNEKLRNIK